ncbi:MAG TPA: hypothetical protein VM848_01285 [Acidimicrobiia bacterium]|nr:hypothetical protein [Acidimicrobiia bacterium]
MKGPTEGESPPSEFRAGPSTWGHWMEWEEAQRGTQDYVLGDVLMRAALRIHQVRRASHAWDENGAGVGRKSHTVVAMRSPSSLDDLLRTGTTVMLHTAQCTDPRHLRLVLGILGSVGMTAA